MDYEMNENLSLFLVVGGVLFTMSILFILIAFKRFIQYGLKKNVRSHKQKKKLTPCVNEISFFYAEELDELIQLKRQGVMSEADFLYQKAILAKRHHKTMSKLKQCEQTPEEREIAELTEAKKMGMITEDAFRREMDRIMFKKYLC
jgi:hypothetical protein